MKNNNRSTVVLSLVCLSLLIIASCATKDIKGGEEWKKPQPGYPKSKIMGKPDKAPETSVREEDLAAEKKDETASLAVLKADTIDPRILSEIRIFESTPIYFDFDQSVLTIEARATLAKLAKWLQSNSQYAARIEGHGDERGSEGYNLALGQMRANAAEKYLQMLGIEADRISTVSYGEEKPADPGKNEAAWAKNRRDEFKLIRNP